jgi:3-hydroxymyristoyl/3-hydroxydecanoyl-(acyl carrier protein) dehydratase
MFMSVDNARFRTPVRPRHGDADGGQGHPSPWRRVQVPGEAKVDGKLAAEAEWGAMVVDNAP